MAGSWAVLRGTHLAEGLPVLGEVPEFTLESSRHAEIRSASLRGAPWVADFIFTSCPGTCPTMSAQMARLQRGLVERGLVDVRSVSISVDPATDSPEVLQEYAERSPEENTDGEGIITHSDRFVLVDGAGHLRGYYHGTDPADVDRLLADIETLHAEG
jgi:protein SCO1/2